MSAPQLKILVSGSQSLESKFLSLIMSSLPSHFNGIGYTKDKNGLPLESIRVPALVSLIVPIRMRVACSPNAPLRSLIRSFTG
jgi:hypothetical protein